MEYCSELTVASLLVYPPKGTDTSDAARRFVRYRIKQAEARIIEQTVSRLRTIVNEGLLGDFFSAPQTLVPVPGHAPLIKDALWVPRVISDAMVAAGLGSAVVPCLRRTCLVPRQSSLTSADERMSPADHVDSLVLEGALELGSRVLLVDDFVTRGATLLAAASLIRHQRPDIEIAAFALVRGGDTPLSATADMLAPTIEVVSCESDGTAPVRRGIER